jgi:hypothetical protein
MMARILLLSSANHPVATIKMTVATRKIRRRAITREAASDLSLLLPLASAGNIAFTHHGA